MAEGLEMAAVERREDRELTVRQGLRLEWLTVGWNIVEGVVAVFAAMNAGSVALLGFGIDRFVESASQPTPSCTSSPGASPG